MEDQRRQRREQVSITQAARIAGVSRRTIYNWLDKNRLDFVRTVGGAVRIYTDSLFTHKAMRGQEEEPEPPAA